MKKNGNIKSTEELLNLLSINSEDIINKNLSQLYLKGAFYKLDRIKMKIETGRFHTKTKHKMLEFIRLSVLTIKVQKCPPEYFIREYSETELKRLWKKFKEIGIIPTPISVRQKFEEWSFM